MPRSPIDGSIMADRRLTELDSQPSVNTINKAAASDLRHKVPFKLKSSVPQTETNKVVRTCNEEEHKSHNVIGRKPSLSYIALISMAIQSAPDQKMLLSEIYQWICNAYSYYKMADKSWRNSIRHNLSLNECFVKSVRSDSGKGSYWSIHPANMADFAEGDYRRRHARKRVRKCDDDLRKLCSGQSEAPKVTGHAITSLSNEYVPMTSTRVAANFFPVQFGFCSNFSIDELMINNRNAPLHQNIAPNRPPCQSVTCLQSMTNAVIPQESTVYVNVNVNLCGAGADDRQKQTPLAHPWYEQFKATPHY